MVSIKKILKSHLVLGPQWGYGKSKNLTLGPTDWYKIAPQCAGTAQSPIDLDCYSLKSNIWKETLAIDFDNEGGLVVGSFTNNGHSPTLAIEKSLGSATLSGGPVGDTVFQLEQFHFHFGCSSFQGSEHTVSGSSYPVEAHFVFYNTSYTDFARAADKADGLTVVGAFFELGSEPNGILSRLKSKFEMIVAEGRSVPVVETDKIFLKDLVPAFNNGSPYYTYQGSLTTPPCFESVRWIVLSETAPFSPSQLIMFNRLQSSTGYGDGKMCNNFRPVQPRKGRDVFLIY
ncbi:carbonic anhydrase-like [Pocillopora verrucosa]|uniref:carbonic anhydrase-like n=1 Tax=Pocillopora verrucosa TaxID=203993 RepID=UPI00333F5AC7